MVISIYIPRNSSRIQYIFKHIFVRILDVPISFTTEVSEFVAHDGPKISYASKPLGDEFFVKAHGVLSVNGIDQYDIDMIEWDDLPGFFGSQGQGMIPFDMFAASFYLLSRYEEYLPHVKDAKGRFIASESVASEQGFLEKPVVDLWAFKLLRVLKEKFPQIEIEEKEMTTTIGVEVDSIYKYRNRGMIESMIILLENASKFKFSKVISQISSILRLRKDPLDNYQKLIDTFMTIRNGQSKTEYFKKRMICFFHLGDYNTVDRGVSYQSRSYQELIKHIGDYLEIGLRFSFLKEDEQKIDKEYKRFENITKRPLTATIAAYSKIAMPGHYRLLVDMDTIEDYSMGYPETMGYRAGTCRPFYFYDLDYEVQTPLKVVPYAIHKGSIRHLSYENQLRAIRKIQEPCKEVGGGFVMMFTNKNFTPSDSRESFKLVEEVYHE